MNELSQLSTLKQVEDVKKLLANMGGGVKEHYIPEYGGPYVVPENGDRKFYHLRFNNGNEGFNVGLIIYFIKSFPVTWPLMLSQQIEAKPYNFLGD